MQRLLSALVLIAAASLASVAPGGAQDCTGTSGSATIGSTPWTATCAFAVTVPNCIDSTGTNYECFEILGTSDSDPLYQSLAIFLAHAPLQGQTYNLGSDSGNGALVVGEGGFFITADAPYTGQVHFSAYGAGTFACEFSFDARSLFFGPDISVTDGTFAGTLLPVEPHTWTDVKNLYR